MATTKGPKPGTGKVASKGEVVVNLSGVEARARKAIHLPAGNYRAKVTKCETFKSKNGNAPKPYMPKLTPLHSQLGTVSR